VTHSEQLNSARKWWICGFLFLATVLNYLDRQVLALTAEKVMAEFRLTKESFGEVLSAFRYAYGIFQIVGGWSVDGCGPRLVYPAAVTLWSLAGILTAFAQSVRVLSGFRFALGVGEAFNWPCALKVTYRLIPAKDRALANGIFNSGAAAGALLAPLIVTFMTLYFGWRAAFVATGTLGAFWVAGWLWCTRPLADELGGAKLSAGELLVVVTRILGNRGFWMLAVTAVIVNSVSYFLADWIPLYLKTECGFGFAAGNLLSMFIYGNLEVGNILVGLFVRRLVALGLSVPRARKSALLVSCTLMSSGILTGFTPYVSVAVVSLMFVALGVASFLVIYHTLLQDLEPGYVGTVSGLLGGLGNLVYGYLSPSIGRLADLGQSSFTFALVGVLPWLAFLAMRWGTQERKS